MQAGDKFHTEKQFFITLSCRSISLAMYIFNVRSKLPPGLDRWLTNKAMTIEATLGLFSLLAALLHYLKVIGGAEAMMISMSALAGFYFVLAYTTPGLEGILTNFLFKILNIASSVIIIGLLFTFLNLSGSEEMLVIGTWAIAVCGAIIVYLMVTKWNEKLTPLTIRIFALGLLTFSVKFF
jgi:hypothetical protein